MLFPLLPQLQLYLGEVHSQGNIRLFCNHAIGQMNVAAVMKRTSTEARIQVIQVALGIQTWCQLLRGSPLVSDRVKDTRPGVANQGRSSRGENNVMVVVKENGSGNTSKLRVCLYKSVEVRRVVVVCCSHF